MMPAPMPTHLRFVRGTRVILHLLGGLLWVLAAFPFLSVARRREVRTRWSRQLLRYFGFTLQIEGTLPEQVGLIAANHVSWIDIVALHAFRMMGFVAKREIASWPVVGWLATMGETIYHQRGSQESLGGVLHEMLARLREGRAVGVFPEGRTRDGDAVGPFHARIFLAAVEANVPVQPVALRYGEGGDAQTVVAFGPTENFAENFLRLLGEPARAVRCCSSAAVRCMRRTSSTAATACAWRACTAGCRDRRRAGWRCCCTAGRAASNPATCA